MRDVDDNAILIDLLTKKYVDIQMMINPEKRNDFFAEYPEFASGVKSGKITDRNKKNGGSVRIRKAVYSDSKVAQS